MQSTTVLVNAHSSCPKCGATIEGDNKSCGSCGSVSFTYHCFSEWRGGERGENLC